MPLYAFKVRELATSGGAIQQILPLMIESIPDEVRKLQWYIFDDDVVVLEQSTLQDFRHNSDTAMNWSALVDKISVIESAFNIIIVGYGFSAPISEIEKLYDTSNFEGNFVSVSLFDGCEWRVSSNILDVIKNIVEKVL
ncbi:hypothetical protein HNP52_000797 [Sphingomonas kyeonggiensis]|uniref:Uncharacterized protein n=1 Tax=Sphingomonas kyeonggiensis TaxID=1268553 RepID=A0A7W7JYL2_9SPHN|nr:hypothetical protein [Sphingomonas kyeonggiensis]MBB4837746.1 hypothetical protein [Sphingomonas kyeonggiensis]